MKQGENFEKLVAWISSCLHKDAIITPNDKLIDKYTGKKRQVDITIKMSDGPTKFIAIVEARDRSRPVGIAYIEEINQKKESVNANDAVIISNKGFYKTALIKAEAYGLKTFDLKEALHKDWSKTLQLFQGVFIKEIHYENATLYFLEKATNRIINPHISFIQKLESPNKSDLIFSDINGKPLISILQVINLATSNIKLRNHLEKINGTKTKLNLVCDIDKKPVAYFKDENNQLQPLERFVLVADYWIETQKLNPPILQYRSTSDPKIFAEVINFNDELDLLIENPNDINKDRKIYIRRKRDTSN